MSQLTEFDVETIAFQFGVFQIYIVSAFRVGILPHSSCTPRKGHTRVIQGLCDTMG